MLHLRAPFPWDLLRTRAETAVYRLRLSIPSPAVCISACSPTGVRGTGTSCNIEIQTLSRGTALDSSTQLCDRDAGI